MTFCSKIVTI